MRAQQLSHGLHAVEESRLRPCRDRDPVGGDAQLIPLRPEVAISPGTLFATVARDDEQRHASRAAAKVGRFAQCQRQSGCVLHRRLYLPGREKRLCAGARPDLDRYSRVQR